MGFKDPNRRSEVVATHAAVLLSLKKPESDAAARALQEAAARLRRSQEQLGDAKASCRYSRLAAKPRLELAVRSLIVVLPMLADDLADCIPRDAFTPRLKASAVAGELIDNLAGRGPTAEHLADQLKAVVKSDSAAASTLDEARRTVERLEEEVRVGLLQFSSALAQARTVVLLNSSPGSHLRNEIARARRPAARRRAPATRSATAEPLSTRKVELPARPPAPSTSRIKPETAQPAVQVPPPPPDATQVLASSPWVVLRPSMFEAAPQAATPAQRIGDGKLSGERAQSGG